MDSDNNFPDFKSNNGNLSFYEDDIAKAWIEKDIAYFEYKEGCVVDLKVQKLHIEKRIKLSQGVKRPVFADARKGVYWTDEARKYSFAHFDYASAFAMLINTPIVHKIFANYLLRFYKLPIPVKIFTDKEMALEWFEQFKEVK